MTSLERDRVPSPRPIAAREIPLVDRVEEMNVLKEAVYRAVHGEGGLAFIHGEAGIGKTRLVREVGAYARSRGVQVLYGRCPALFRMDGVPPYVLWKEIIRDYVRECTPEQLNRVIGFYPAEVAKLVPEISQKLRAYPQSFPISPEQEQNRLFEAVSQFITNISEETPLMIILDDLQWTDPSSLLLMHYLARGVQKAPLLLLGAYRSTDIDDKHPLTPVLSELNRESLAQSIHLKRMPLGDVSEIIQNVLEQENVPSEFCRLIYEKTRGNPFFVGEVLKSLKEEGVIYREKNRWEFREVSKIEFPETVKSVLKARLARLDEECQSILTFASFIGNDFTLEAICALTEIEENKLLELMDKMLKTGLIREREVHGEGVCSFADVLVRDVVYEEVSLLKRKKLHGVVGSALENVYAKTVDDHLGELAQHFLEGGDKSKALDYFLKAGGKAKKIYANNEAVSYYQSALRLLEEKGGEFQERGRVLESLGDIKKPIGKYEDCVRCWNEALELFKQMDERETVARLYRKIANVLWSCQGNTEKAKIYHEEALRILEKEHEGSELARLFDDMSSMYLRTEDVPKARSWAEKALDLAEKLNAHEVIASSNNNLGNAFSLAEDMKKAAEYYERALKIALDSGYMETAIRAYSSLSTLLPSLEIGALVNERSFEILEKAYELAKKAGDVHWVSYIGTALSDAYWGMGNMEKGVSLVEESVLLARKAGDITNLSYALNELGSFCWTGEWDKSEQFIKEALSLAQKAKDTQQIMFSFFCFGVLYSLKSEWAKAAEQFQEAIEVAEETGARSLEYWWKSSLAWPYIELGEIEKAKSLLDDVLKFSSESKDIVLTACADSYMASLFRAQKKWEESIAFFEKSIQEYEAFNAGRFLVYWFAKVHYEYARMYLERDQQGDREMARSLLNRALEIFQKLGAKREIEATEAKLMRLDGRQSASELKPVGYVATGYADLDKLLYGGIPPNCAVVLTSPSCKERDLLVRNFLETGAKKGEVTFFVTIDPTAAKLLAEEFQPNFYLFVCNPEADAIIKDSPNVLKMKGVENLTEISIALTSAIRQLDPSLKDNRRICIDLLSDVLLQHHAVETRRWLTALVTKLKSEGFTTLAIVDPQIHPPEELHAIVGLFGGEINIHEKETEKGSERYLKIKRMSNQKYLEDELPLKNEQE